MTEKWLKRIERATRWTLRRKGFKSRFVDAQGARIHYFDRDGRGDLPPVLLIHGLSADATDVANMFPLYKHTRRLMAIDLPGHGLSEPPARGMKPGPAHSTLAYALDTLLNEPTIIIGNSLGGLAAIRYANHRPEQVKGLILLSPGGAQMDESQLAEFKDRFSNRDRNEAKEFLDLLMVAKPWYQNIVERMVVYRFGRPEIQELMSHVTTEVLLKPDEIKGLQPPTHLLWGARDWLQAGQLQFFKDHAPEHLQFHEPEHYSHCPFLDYPKEVNKKLLELMQDFA